MKKVFIVLVLILVLIGAFAVCSFAVSFDDLSRQENVVNVSAIIKVLEDNGVSVDTQAPFQSGTAGQIMFGFVSNGRQFESTIQLQDLIDDYDVEKSYVFFIQSRSFISNDEEIRKRALPNVCFYAAGTLMCGDTSSLPLIHGLSANSVITMVFHDNIDMLYTPVVAEYNDAWIVNDGYVTVENHVTNRNWPRSADFEAGYLYQPEMSDEPTMPNPPAGDDAEDPPAGGGISDGNTTILDGVSDAISGVMAAVSGSVATAVPEWQQAGIYVRIALVLTACGGGLLLIFIFLRPVGAHARRRRRR